MDTSSREPSGELVETVFDRAAPKLRRYFRTHGCRAEAEDLVQECFRRTMGRRSIRPEAYLMRTAVNLAIEHWRAHARRPQVPLEDFDLAGPDPLAQIEAADLLRRVTARLDRLSPRTREIYLQNRVDGLTYAELAERHGLSLAGIEYHMTKALKHLRRLRSERP